MEINNLALYLSGQPVPVPSCNIIVSQPTIKEIVAMGEEPFLNVAQLLGRSANHLKSIKQGNPELQKLSDFQIVMILSAEDSSIKESIDQFFELIFPIYDVTFDTEGVSLSFSIKDSPGQIVGMINNFNYQDFFKTIEELFLLPSSKDEIEYDPANDRANAIAEKLKKGREKVSSIKRKESGQSDVFSLFATYTSVLSIGMNLDINVLFSYTPFQLYDAFLRYWKKVAYDIYQKVSTTPLMDVSKMDKPDDWSLNLY